MTPHAKAADFLAADWLDAGRARRFVRVLAIFTLLATVGWIDASRGGLDREGKPLGTDFLSFYAASVLVLKGQAAAVYDVASHWSAQKALFGDKVGYSAFFYPPIFLLVCAPLALFPYFVSLALWTLVTLAAFVRVVALHLRGRASWVAIAAFPAVLSNAGHGQNGFLSAALIGAGVLWIGERPVLAGMCFGALAYKPQLALMIPVALIAGRRWTTFGVAAATASALALISLEAFGIDAFRGWAADMPLARASLEGDLVGHEKFQSVFAAIRLWHGPLWLAYGLQTVTAFAAAAALWIHQRRSFRDEAEGPALVAATLVATPFLLDYDLTLLAIPLAFAFRRGVERGFAPGEKLVLAAAYVLPLMSRSLSGLGLPVAPFVLAAVAYVVIWPRTPAASAPIADASPDLEDERREAA